MKRVVNKPNFFMVVTGKLQWLKGNKKPYFSLTAHGKDHGCEFAGCNHEEILKHFPDLEPLADLHLSDIDGIPMHALENGFYHLGGSSGTLDFKYFNQNKVNLKYAANHFRITEEGAQELLEFFGDHFSIHAGFLGQNAAKEAKARLAAWVKSQLPRWKREAEQAIKQFELDIPTSPEK